MEQIVRNAKQTLDLSFDANSEVVQFINTSCAITCLLVRVSSLRLHQRCTSKGHISLCPLWCSLSVGHWTIQRCTLVRTSASFLLCTNHRREPQVISTQNLRWFVQSATSLGKAFKKRFAKKYPKTLSFSLFTYTIFSWTSTSVLFCKWVVKNKNTPYTLFYG